MGSIVPKLFLDLFIFFIFTRLIRFRQIVQFLLEDPPVFRDKQCILGTCSLLLNNHAPLQYALESTEE